MGQTKEERRSSIARELGARTRPEDKAKGGRNRWAGLTAEQRTAAARKASAARWGTSDDLGQVYVLKGNLQGYGPPHQPLIGRQDLEAQFRSDADAKNQASTPISNGLDETTAESARDCRAVEASVATDPAPGMGGSDRACEEWPDGVLSACGARPATVYRDGIARCTACWAAWSRTRGGRP